MTETLVLLGMLCVIAAITGGALSYGSVKVPELIDRPFRQGLLAAIGIALALLGFRWDAMVGSSPAPSPQTSVPDSPPAEPPGSPPATPSSSPPASAAVAEGPWSNTVGGLTFEVLRVTRRADGSLELAAAVDNQTGDGVSLPLAGFFVVGPDVGGGLEADPFESQWPTTFPSGARTEGTIVIDGPVAPEARSMRLDFTQVFGTFALNAIGVAGVAIPPG